MTLSNCSSNENGGVYGGKSGDQTGREYSVINWYSRPWDCVYEPPTEKIGEDLAYLAANAANNDKIGYDWDKRTTFYTQLMKAKDYDPKNIKTACETDCSASTSALVIACGKRNKNSKMASMSKDCWTGNIGQALINAGFKKHTDSKYLTSDKYLGPGWIPLNTQCHVAINLTKGANYKSTTKTTTATTTPTKTTTTKTTTTAKSKYKTGTYKITAPAGVNVRSGAGTSYTKKTALAKGTTIKVTAIKQEGKNYWGKTSKGYICIEQNGSVYAKRI